MHPCLRKTFLPALFAATAMLAGCSSAAPPASASAAPASALAGVEAEAQAFMTAYGENLRLGERAQIVGRYHPGGAEFFIDGQRIKLSHDQIREIYMGQWAPPADFAWHDLAYRAIDRDNVFVTGLFEWTLAGATDRVAFAGLLRRTPEGLRLVHESETKLRK